MVRLDYFLMRGGLLVNDDYMTNKKGIDGAVGKATSWNNGIISSSHWYIESFTPRTNDNKQPVPNDFPVVVLWSDGLEEVTEAMWVSWGHDGIESWTPDIEKLLEQQSEYDKAQAEHDVMISENAKPEFVHGQDVYAKDGSHKDKPFKFGCYTLDGKGVIILHDSGYAYTALDNLSSKPIKTKEEIELEEAKKKQVSEISGDLWRTGVMRYRDDIDPVIEYMQSAGFLAEILLPLETK